MSRTNYERGVEKERKAMEYLDSCGYITMRTAGSHGIFDVIALGPTGVRLIQIKRVKKDENWTSEYESAKDQMQKLPKIHASYEVWIWEDYSGFIIQDKIETCNVKSLGG